MDKLIVFIIIYTVFAILVRYIGYKDGHYDGYKEGYIDGCKRGKDDMIDVIQQHMQENYKLVREENKWKIMQK